MKTAEAQGVPIMVMRNKGWLEANNLALELVSSPYYMRMDDDMFLHPRALEFMLSTYRGHIAHTGKLYEHFARRCGGKIKVYNTENVRELGGFRPNSRGKIDRTFERDAKEKYHRITTADKHSPIGLHACGTWKEQQRYEELWGYKKSSRGFMKKYRKSPEWQAENTVRIIERYNKTHNTEFWKWLNASQN